MADSMFDKVMAEEWSLVEVDPEPEEQYLQFARIAVGTGTLLISTEQGDATRANIAVLGKRALALILEHEFCGAHLGECPECGGVPVELAGKPGGHAKDCEWGLVVAGVEKLRENAAAE